MASPLDHWLLLLAGIAATYLWRGLGVVLSWRLNPEGALFEWVSCVSYAMLAGLVARMMVLPAGSLAETALSDRLLGTALGFAVFFACGRKVLPGVGAGVGLFILLVAAREQGWW